MDEIENRLRTSLEDHLGGVEAFPLESEALRRATRRRVFMGIVSVAASVALVVAGGVFVPRLLSTQDRETQTASGDADLPTVAVIRCTNEGTVVETPKVRAEGSGVRLRIINDSGARFYERRSMDADENEGGRLEKDGVTEFPTSAPPGDHVVGCFVNQDGGVPYGVTDHPAFTRLTIVDPEGIWNPVKLACGDNVEQSRAKTGIPVQNEDYDEIAREHISGIEASDELERPGYPGGYPIFESRTIIRDGDRIARVSFAGRDTWDLLVSACRGVEIEAGQKNDSPYPEVDEWEPADAYRYEVNSACGERSFYGHYRIEVRDGQVTNAEGLDESGKAGLRYEGEILTLEELLAQAEAARLEGADSVEVVYDSPDGRPTEILIDYYLNGVDDEACYEITAYEEL